jgi:hypothetical protein
MLKKLFGFGKAAIKAKDQDAVSYGVDVEMNYCPSCGDEYRADIEQCVTCKVALISGREKLEQKRQKVEAFNGRSMDISADDELVTIKNGKLRDLKPYQILLAKERIPALLTGESGGCGKG